MDETKKKIASARRRLHLNQFLQVFSWVLFAVLIFAAIGIAIPKLWHLQFLDSPRAQQFWTAGWIIGGAVLGVLVSALISWFRRRSLSATAQEVDRRFNLRERLSSALAMTEQERQTPAGTALAADAQRRAEDIVITEHFKIETRWSMALPMIPAAIVGIMLLVPNAVLDNASVPVAAAAKKTEQKKVKTAVEELQKKIRERRITKGLSDAQVDLKKIEKQFDDLNRKSDVSKKDALVKLNDIKKQIEERQRKLGSSDDFRNALNQLKDIGQGPAKQLADAVKAGNMKAAKKAIQSLADKIKSGKMTESDKERLKKDMAAMAKQLKEMAAKHQQRKKDVKKKLAKALAKGDLDKAAKLQQKLEKLDQQDRQQEKMKKMGERLQKCANCMKSGSGQPSQSGSSKSGSPKDSEADPTDVGKELEDLAKQMQEMQDEMEQLQDLEDFQEAIQEAKKAMNQDASEGGQGGKGGKDSAKEGGKGMGEGRGDGDRPIEEDDTGFYKSRVKSKLQRGKTFAAGSADGKNLTGRTTSEAREIINTNMKSRSDPLENQVLPKSQREHAQQYFESLREGK